MRWPSGTLRAVAPVPKEHDEQALYFQWLEYVTLTGPHCAAEPLRKHVYAIPNAARRSYQVAAHMRSEGLTAGVADINVDVPAGRFHGLRLEMKRRNGRGPTDAQIEHLDARRRMGYEAQVAFGFDEARKITTRYLAESFTVTDRWRT